MAEQLDGERFEAWETRQPIRFELVDGQPKRLADGMQVSSRVARVLHIATVTLGDERKAVAWMSAAQSELGGLEPEAVASESEEGCQTVLRLLAVSGRKVESGG